MSINKGLLARLEAKPGKEDEVEEFLKSALSLAKAEELTIDWFAFKIDDSTFGIYDTFEARKDKTHILKEKLRPPFWQKRMSFSPVNRQLKK